jgi:hypothetical protein
VAALKFTTTIRSQVGHSSVNSSCVSLSTKAKQSRQSWEGGPKSPRIVPTSQLGSPLVSGQPIERAVEDKAGAGGMIGEALINPGENLDCGGNGAVHPGAYEG